MLRASADDHVMRETHDRFVDEVYSPPAVRATDRLGIVSPLGTAVVYDSHEAQGLPATGIAGIALIASLTA